MKSQLKVAHFFRDAQGRIHSREAVLLMPDDAEPKQTKANDVVMVSYIDNDEKALVHASELKLLKISTDNTISVAHETTIKGKKHVRKGIIVRAGEVSTVARVRFDDDAAITEVPLRELLFLGTHE